MEDKCIYVQLMFKKKLISLKINRLLRKYKNILSIQLFRKNDRSDVDTTYLYFILNSRGTVYNFYITLNYIINYNRNVSFFNGKILKHILEK